MEQAFHLINPNLPWYLSIFLLFALVGLIASVYGVCEHIVRDLRNWRSLS